jgi:hypothetical protein
MPPSLPNAGSTGQCPVEPLPVTLTKGGGGVILGAMETTGFRRIIIV